jgi:uncharacterized protein (TIGR03083 family)
MDFADHYAETRARLTELASELRPADGARRVPGCPEWTVKDVYAHLAGVCSDILAGRIEGAATDPWTARQVAERADRTLEQLVEEWAADAPQVETLMRQLGEGPDINRVPIDVWTHEQDVRGAVERPGGRDAPVVAWSLERLVGRLGAGWAGAVRKPVRIRGSSDEWVIGDGEPVATMQASDFELVRTFLGRRSRAQALAMWDGAGEDFVDAFVVFSYADEDLVE